MPSCGRFVTPKEYSYDSIYFFFQYSTPMTKRLNTLVFYIIQKNDYANQNHVFQEFVTRLKKSGMFFFNSMVEWYFVKNWWIHLHIFEGIRRDNENFIVLYYDFDLHQNSTYGKVHISKEEQCVVSKFNLGLLNEYQRLKYFGWQSMSLL